MRYRLLQVTAVSIDDDALQAWLTSHKTEDSARKACRANDRRLRDSQQFDEWHTHIYDTVTETWCAT